MTVQLKLVSSLEKVFPEQAPLEYPEQAPLTGMTNETLSFQAAFSAKADNPWQRPLVTLQVDSPLKEYIRLRRIVCVPVGLAAFSDADDNYLRKQPGLYPDLLSPVEHSRLRLYDGIWQSVWVDVASQTGLPAGTFPITLSLVDDEGEVLARARKEVTVIAAALPAQRLIHTKWFYSDCLSDYYGVPVFGEEYWRITRNFIAAAVKRGINMILTPIHTPPLDTRVGGERTTVQLVEITRRGDSYSFCFDKLERWVKMCRECGVEYFEMAHLFTQWGARFTPKIMAWEDGELKRIFGWDVAVGESYGAFLAQYLPALTGELRRLGIDKVSYFHISDEPGKEHLADYLKAKALAEPYLKGYTIMDALSDYEFYRSGAVTKPVPANNHIAPFLAGKVPGLWTYYCVGQYKDVSNMFMSMPSARNRILGVQLYKFQIEGFLHWGYNFYNSQWSDYPINPYLITDGDGFAPAGDAFQVYPGKDGMPEESIRMMVTAQALYDIRALEMLESLAGRAYVMEMLEQGLSHPITFDCYPLSAQWLLALRARVNSEIARRLHSL
jgi:hypothetical protein